MFRKNGYSAASATSVAGAPMPPEQDAHLIASRDFNNDKFWTFMEAKKFFNGGCGTTVRATQVIHLTKHVTIFNLPPGLLVEVIFVPKWKIKVIIKLVTIVVDHVCRQPVAHVQVVGVRCAGVRE